MCDERVIREKGVMRLRECDGEKRGERRNENGCQACI